MSLQVWLPLNGTLDNQGLSNVVVTNTGATVDNNGKIGKCYSFDGSDDGIRIDGDILPQLQKGDFSICFWAYSNDAGDRSIYIATTPASDWGFSIEKTTGNKLRVYWQGNPDFNTTLDVPNQQWCHIAVVIKNGNCYCYKNGEKLAERTSGDMTPDRLSRTWIYAQLGRGTRTGSTVLNGKMNDFRWYDHALSEKEVKELAKGLVLHYLLNRGGFGNENLLSRYVVPGQAAPTSTAAGGRTTWLGDYKITIPATENADTYFRLFTTKQLTANAIYTISCKVDGLLSGSYYRFPLYAQSNTAMGVLNLDHNGLCSLTFTMTYGTQAAATGANGETVYICFMDDVARSITSGQGAITISNFKLEEGSIATPWCPNSSDALADTMGLNGTTEYDCSGFRNNGTKWSYDSAGEITYTSDTPKYYAATFINSDNNTTSTASGTRYIYGNCSLVTPQYLTVAFWCKPIAGYRNNTQQGQFSLTNNDIGANAGADYQNCPMNHRDSRVDINGSDNTTHKSVNIDFTANQWHHYAIVYDGRYGRVYKDGAAGSTIDMGSNMALCSMKGLVIGFSKAGNAWRSNKSYYSDFRIYATALSADDVKELYSVSASIDNAGNLYSAEVVEG